MIQYLPVSSKQVAMDISKSLWDLAAPPATRAQGNTTIYFCGWAEDINGQWYLQIPSAYQLPIHPDITQAMIDGIVTQIEQQEDALP
jgi:hypothetical protein